jgi:hypothetical protein
MRLFSNHHSGPGDSKSSEQYWWRFVDDFVTNFNDQLIITWVLFVYHDMLSICHFALYLFHQGCRHLANYKAAHILKTFLLKTQQVHLITCGTTNPAATIHTITNNGNIWRPIDLKGLTFAWFWGPLHPILHLICQEGERNCWRQAV